MRRLISTTTIEVTNPWGCAAILLLVAAGVVAWMVLRG